jgi:hypothetical protein
MIECFKDIMRRYVPENALYYCIKTWETHPFSFKVTRKRTSKVGDYRFNKSTGNHEISVNGNLNPYAFLITYLHEAAHLYHYKKYGNNQPPHGRIWKKVFQELMKPVLQENVFPPDILQQLILHMKNPKASSQSDPVLVKLLRKYDRDHDQSDIYLEDLIEGESFNLNGRSYIKLKKRRTRSLCEDRKSGRKYLISELTRVMKSKS